MRSGLNWGPLVVGVMIAADYYAAGIELGLVHADYERAMEQWLQEKREWEQENVTEPDPSPTVVMRPARMEDFKVILGRLNGDGAKLTERKLEEELAADHLLLPSPSTVQRWLKLARK